MAYDVYVVRKKGTDELLLCNDNAAFNIKGAVDALRSADKQLPYKYEICKAELRVGDIIN